MDKLEEYKERHLRWQQTTITQMGFVNNMLIALAIGFLAVTFKNNQFVGTKLWNNGEFDWDLVFNGLVLISLFLSVCHGILTALSRLYDFRITRNITLTRQRFFEYAYRKKLPKRTLPNNSFPEPNFIERKKAIIKIICNINLINKQESENIRTGDDKIIMEKFNNLRRLSNTLGIVSWHTLKCQMACLLLSFVLYSIGLFL